MAKSLAKIQKKISKKKGNVNSLHEKSRDSYKLRRATARAEKLKRRAAERVRLNQYYGTSMNKILLIMCANHT